MASLRPRPQVMKLTEAAADRIKAIMAKADKPFAGVRVGVKNGGCAGMAYTMEYAESAEKFDEVVEDKGVKLLIDPKAVMFLLGTEMDFKVDKLSSTFVFNNPNQTSACGCGVGAADAGRRSGGRGSALTTPWTPKRSASSFENSDPYLFAACSAAPAFSSTA